MDRLPPYAVAGRGIRFSGRLTVDGTGVGGEEVRVRLCSYVTPTLCSDIGSTMTRPDGTWYLDWSVGYEYACSRYYFKAVHPASGAESAMQLMAVAYPTRLSITAPSRVTTGAPFRVEGKLEYENPAGRWNPLGGRRVSIYYDDTKLVDVTTASDGSYTATVSIPTPGTYTLKAYYAGEGITATAAAIAVAGAEIPEHVIPLAGIGAVVAFIAIPILANALKK
jgi:hypothetical protein